MYKLYNGFVLRREDDEDRVWIKSDWLRLVSKWDKVENKYNKISESR